jgi:ATP-dependent DNA helicase RecG
MSMASLQASWDAHQAVGCSIKDIDFNKVTKFINKVNAVGRFSLEGSPKECLEKLRLINKNTVSNAAVLLFAVERWVRELRDNGKIIYKGSNKKGGYWITGY